ncbi:hypothetical protein WDU94_000862 [Cyamophila willieti]
MKPLFILIFVGMNLNLSPVTGDFFDITTVYKFNIEEESDANGDTVTKYLDTCQVVVHVQNNAVGLPYINTKETSSNQAIYPLKEPSIPDETQWKILNIDATTTSFSEQLTEEPIEFYNYLKHDTFPSFVKHKFSVLNEKLEETEYRSEYRYQNYYRYSSYDSHYENVLYYKYNFDLSTVNVLGSTYLFLENEKINEKDIKFYLKHNEEHDSVAVDILKDGYKIKICNKLSSSNCSSYSYAQDYHNQISILMTFKDELIIIYDLIRMKVITFPFKGPFIRLEQSPSASYKTPITFKIVRIPQKVLSLTSNQTIATPSFHDIRNNTNLLIVHYRNSAGNMTAHLKEENTDHVIPLITKDQVLKKGNVHELILTKVKVHFPQNWTEKKQIQIKADKGVYIMKMWEGGNLKKYRLYENKTCAKKRIGEIYDVAVIEPRRGKQINTCQNGGFADQYNETCVCPPGFTGSSCELACGRNYYGHECSNICSTTETECKGIILCTPSHGCSCAPGYYGDKCLQQCEEGRYGADCKQSCGNCKEGCDKYTGHCLGECVNAYLIKPTCREYHTSWKGSPKVVNSSFNSVSLSLNFDLDSIVRSSVETQFFMVQYKESVETYWTNCSYKTFRPTVIEYEVENLKTPGRNYLFRVLLVAKSLDTNNPEQSQQSATLTKCRVSEIMENLNVTKVTNTSIALAWNKETPREDNTECPFTSYLLEIEEARDDFVEKRKILNIKNNFFVIKYLDTRSEIFYQVEKVYCVWRKLCCV